MDIFGSSSNSSSTRLAFRLFACLLAGIIIHAGHSLEILEVTLQGGTEDYIEVNRNVPYVLSCNYRTPYDDPVKEVLWQRYGRPFYSWAANGIPTVLDEDFLGMIDTSPAKNPHNLHFRPPINYDLAGGYSCLVSTSSEASANASYMLRIIDAESGPYYVTVEALSKIKQEEESNSSLTNADYNDQYKYEVDEPGNDGDTEVDFEDEACTLVWSLATPPLYPRPNVTCGHYSFDHEDVVERLPAGLTLHKFPNGSWTASFYQTHIQVSSLPKNHRLGCTIRFPGTTYKKVVRAEDNLWVESLIDTGGCPGLLDIQEGGVIVDITEASYTCRGDVLPADRTGRALASLSCPYGQRPLFPEGTAGDWDDGIELSCAENDIGWRRYYPDDPSRLGDLVNPAKLPLCVPGTAGAEAVTGYAWSLVLTLTLVVGWQGHA